MSEHGFHARRILRAASSASLATQLDGQPFASLVTHAVAPDGALLLWLSTMSQHTRQLQQEPRCAVLAQGAPTTANPQTVPRVTVTGLAEKIEDPGLKSRWLARHPYAAQYAEFADFALWRILPQAALLVGGFAAAHRIRAADLAPDAPAVEAILVAEAEIIAHVNADHADAVEVIAGGGGWRMTAVDVDGCDMRLEHTVRRLEFPAPVSDADGVRKALILAARAARAG
ncbi:MAG: pyridoxamine 5'-phosphate oxidase family protein [Alphaproteobacteria bacterium]|nr:pyridoxamine 5'-phosphate oxidase family protein [Alphaproteobacteria bacterium]